MKDLFTELLKDGNCIICYADKCDCSEVIPKEEVEHNSCSSGKLCNFAIVNFLCNI